jgi:dienelactone hydrolase
LAVCEGGFMELGLQETEEQQLLELSKWQKTKTWLNIRYTTRNARDHFVWRIAAGSTASFGSLSMLAAVLGMPTGLGTAIDIIAFLAINAAAMSLAAVLLSFLLNLMYLPLPRRFTSVWLYVAVETYLILYFAELGILMSIIFSLAFTLSGALAGCLLGFLIKMRIRSGSKAILAFCFACVIAVCFVYMDWPGPAPLPQRESVQHDQIAAGSVAVLDAPNPAEQGKLAFQAFSYGSGKDKHRAIFADEADMLSAAVDASAYITNWSSLKTRFWGFDEHALPLNGRVWMPEGAGPFPIALIVHGNHLMEDFSDGGYGYLGEMLASKGIIAVSVDENFLNYSVWSGIPNNDMKVRAWVLLKHLQQIKQFNESTGNPFTNRVDLERVALIGHSRGGQAVAMAADAERWFKDDKTLNSLKGAAIKSVIAIAPTDKQVDDKSARLTEVNYLTLQGARDADVNNFYGDRQFSRTTFEEQSGKFKAALYIADANHSQFNSEWGRMDERPPGGLFLNRHNLLEADEQRQISKVYVSAFLQATLLGDERYQPLFKDYRTGLAWLPDTMYTNRYEESTFTEITRFDDGKRKTVLKDGGKASASGMKEWQIVSAEDRDGKNKGTKGMELEWGMPGAEYELEIPHSLRTELDDGIAEGNLVFSMANLERDLIVKEEADGKVEVTNDTEMDMELPPLPEIEIELTTSDGESRELELADIMPVSPPAYTAFMSLSWLEERMKEEKYNESNEPVFQTYVLPIEEFGTEEKAIAAQDISRITFRFVNGPGKVMIDDIGFMP